MGYAKPFSKTGARPSGSLEELAAAFALRPAAEAEELIESFCAEAIGQWRLQDATFWQRVKFRARMLRAMQVPRNDVGGTDTYHQGRR